MALIQYKQYKLYKINAQCKYINKIYKERRNNPIISYNNLIIGLYIINMGIIIDLISIGIIALSTFLGYKKGLIGVAFKILSFIIAIVITLVLYRPITSYIVNNTNIAMSIENTIVEKLGTVEVKDGKIEKENIDLPNVIVNYINEQITNTVNNTKDTVVKTVAKELTIQSINLIVMVAIFIITRILLLFAKAVLEAVSELPIIKQFNEAGGIIYGVIRGILLIYIILAIISLILPMLNKAEILNLINGTIITKILYNNNLILMLFF